MLSVLLIQSFVKYKTKQDGKIIAYQSGMTKTGWSYLKAVKFFWKLVFGRPVFQIYTVWGKSQVFSMKTVSAVRFKLEPKRYGEFFEECNKRSIYRRDTQMFYIELSPVLIRKLLKLHSLMIKSLCLRNRKAASRG